MTSLWLLMKSSLLRLYMPPGSSSYVPPDFNRTALVASGVFWAPLRPMPPYLSFLSPSPEATLRDMREASG